MVETFLNVDGQPTLLRIETTKEHKELSIPSFLDVIREVTHDKDHVSSKMADQVYKLPESDKKAIKERVKQNKPKAAGNKEKTEKTAKPSDTSKSTTEKKVDQQT